MTGYSFVYATTLSGLHLSFATLAGLLCLCLARFLPPSSPSPSLSSPAPLSPSASLIPPSAAPPPAPVPTLPAWEVGRFTLLSNVCVVTTNFALLANSVGFYQISRLAIIPLTCAFEALLHGKAYSPPTLAAVLVVLVGVGVCTVTDVTVSAFGLVTAAAGAVSTSLQQIVSVVSGRVATALCPGLIRPAHSDRSPASKVTFVKTSKSLLSLPSLPLLHPFPMVQSVGELQQRYALGSFDLLIQTAPLQAASLLLLGPAVDYLLTGYSVIHYTLTADATVGLDSPLLHARPPHHSQCLPLSWFLSA
ncbi:unnamed protein product [Closterium sp. Naga37s-1]|nr:unnamed protein product [Closterium sp. Naga37s-1]